MNGPPNAACISKASRNSYKKLSQLDLMHATHNVRRTSSDLTVVMEWLQGTARMFGFRHPTKKQKKRFQQQNWSTKRLSSKVPDALDTEHAGKKSLAMYEKSLGAVSSCSQR